MNWMNRFFTVDFSDVSEFLQTLTTDTVVEDANARTLMGVLLDKDKRRSDNVKWNVQGPQFDQNLEGAVVVYNGPNDRDLPTNAKYSHVLKLTFHKDQRVPDRDIFLQYDLEVS